MRRRQAGNLARSVTVAPSPVGLPGTRQASAPAPGVRLELGPLGRCPRPFPRAPTLEDGTILRPIVAFWGRARFSASDGARMPIHRRGGGTNFSSNHLSRQRAAVSYVGVGA